MGAANDRPAADPTRIAYYASLRPYSLTALWEVLHHLVPPEPSPATVPAHWRYADIRPLLFEAGRLISTDEAERRVLVFENPALAGQSRITQTLYAGLQLLLPGESAACHRHSQSALRFVIEGDGGFTAVNGERVYMHRWDLILTSNWEWHDHGNETASPIIWLDGLDIPLVSALDAQFAERYIEGPHPATRPSGHSLACYGSNMRPVASPGSGRDSDTPLIVYPYKQWREALEMARSTAVVHAHQGLAMEFTNPATGQSVLRTMSAFCQLIPAGLETIPIRSTDGRVFVVVEGHGHLEVGGQRFPLREADIFVVPSWRTRRFRAETDLVLFSFSDKAAQERLGLWRSETSPPFGAQS